MAFISPNGGSMEKVTFSSGKIWKLKQMAKKIRKSRSWLWYEPPENNSVVDFCQNTTLHGLQYVGQQSRHLCERILWLVAFIIAGCSALFFIYRLYTEYLNMPIMTVFNPTETSLDKIPFPAVTICNVNNIRKSKYQEYNTKVTEKLQDKISAESWNETEYYAMLAAVNDVIHICESKETFSERFTGTPKVEENKDVGDQIKKHEAQIQKLMDPQLTLQRGSQTCEEMIMFCVWQDAKINCSELFQEIETDFGSCCVFNMIPVKLLMKSTDDTRDNVKRVQEWGQTDLDYDNIMFDKHNENRTFPFRQLFPGRSSGLSFLVDPDLDDYDCTNTDSEGYMISLNEPLTFPKMKDNGIAVPTGAEVFISVRPEVTLYDDSIKKFTLDKRQCYFGNEKSLPHYTKYTAANCMAECFANRTWTNCTCKPHYMPRDENNTLCTPKAFTCTEKVRQEIKKEGLNKACKCLPTCTEIDYHTEVTSLKIRRKVVSNLLEKNRSIRKFDTTRNASLSIVHVYFGVDAVYPRLRKEMMTEIDLLSNAGGLLGLCMGFSVLSVLEIIYYITIRPLCNYYRKKRNEQQRIIPIIQVQHIGSRGEATQTLENNRKSTGSNSSSNHRGQSFQGKLSRSNEMWSTRVLHSSYATRFKSRTSLSPSALPQVDVNIFEVGGAVMGRKKSEMTEVVWEN